jgi:predicted AAA+ superfamily ATPase
MVLRSEIEIAYLNQKLRLLSIHGGTVREHLSLINGKTGHVQVLSGVRRCGKSTLLRQLIKKYGKNIAFFNFEDPRIYNFELSDFQKLDEIMGKNTAVYFFDEIQNVLHWEIYIRQLHDRKKKIYITGSNASLLSKELGTRLTGRHLCHEIFPFSYTELLKHKKWKPSLKNFEFYIQNGGFPEYLRDENPEVLQLLLKDIVLRDIAIRYSIRNTKTLMDLTLHLISNIGKEITHSRLRKIFDIGSTNSVSDYLAWLEDSYLLFYLPRFSYSAKSISINPKKVYAVDNGLINSNSLSFNEDKGRLLENAAYLFLKKHPFDLFYFRENNECDFVLFEKGKCKMAIQVCEKIHDENMHREVNGLLEAMTFFKLKEGYILTKDQKDLLEINKNKIHIIPLSEWLLKGKIK